MNPDANLLVGKLGALARRQRDAETGRESKTEWRGVNLSALRAVGLGVPTRERERGENPPVRNGLCELWVRVAWSERKSTSERARADNFSIILRAFGRQRATAERRRAGGPATTPATREKGHEPRADGWTNR